MNRDQKTARKKEYREHRTSWKWFEHRFDIDHGIADKLKTKEAFQMRLLIEILKELQFTNDMKS